MPPKKSNNIKSRLKLLERHFFLHGAAGREETFHYEMPDSDLHLWPHSEPSAKLMANCGFYYAPTKKLTDRVNCIGCNQLQQSWDGVDNPAEHHLAKHPDCPFSLIQYYSTLREVQTVDWENIPTLKDPLSDQCTAIRASTFGAYWPFDKIKGANPTSDKMIAAGFSSFPHDENDDLASCMYCGTCLEGWELNDDPMAEHTKRADGRGCYFLQMLEQSKSRKRLSEEDPQLLKQKKTKFANEISEDGKENSELGPISEKERENQKTSKKDKKLKKTKKEKKAQLPAQAETTPPIARPRRAAAEASKKIVDLSDDDEEDNSDVELLDSESFGLTSNEEQLDSEPDTYRSSQRSAKMLKSQEDSLKNASTLKSHKSGSTSPLKKSKILDNSVDDDIFSTKRLDEAIMESLPVSKNTDEEENKSNTFKKKRSSPEPQSKSSPLKDITNLSDGSFIVSPKKRAQTHIIQDDETDTSNSHEDHDEEEEDEEDIILVSNSNSELERESISALSFIKESTPIEAIDHKQESSSTLKPNTIDEHEPDIPQHDSSQDISSSQIEQSPLASKVQSPSIKSENSGSLSRLKLNKTMSNRSILSQSRFVDSPKAKRSQSPFLDSHHQIGYPTNVTDSVVGPNDNPIEESTDHNIDMSLSELDRQLKGNESVKEQEHTPEKINGLEEAHEDVQEDEDEDDSFHSADEVTPNDYWSPTDTNQVFQRLNDLETANKYLSELNRLDYELHDDVDGRVTSFINQMPDDELQMTIEEWIQHMAKQGKVHLEQVCNKMIDDFDEECERAMEKLKSLPTVG